jgi:predicted esterase
MEDGMQQRVIFTRCVFLALVFGILALGSALVNTSPLAAQPVVDTNGTILVNGYSRRFVYATSLQPAPASGRPLVIFLHGDGGNIAGGLSGTWKDAVLNDANGAVLLAAEGRNNIPAAAAIDGSAWRFRMDEAGQPYDDVDFIDQLIEAALNNNLLGTTIDPAQIYVVGESRGAGMAYVLYADPRTSEKVRAIVPISGTFYCEGDEVNEGTPGTQPTAGSDTTCGEISQYGYWGPRPTLFTVARTPHILAIYGQLASGEFGSTAPPPLDQLYGASTWAGWAVAAGCYADLVSAQTEQTLPQQIGGKTVKSYAFSQSAAALATRCTALDLTFYIVQGGGHVPPGFAPTAWCFLSSVGGTPSSSACPGAQNPTATATSSPTATATPSPTTGPADITLNVNATLGRKPISEDIYGLHEADEAFAAEIDLPVRRNGGNLATRYNWQNNATNSGLDYYFVNRPADISANDFIERDRRTGTRSIITIPMTGWVAKDTNNSTCGFNLNTYSYTPQSVYGAPPTNPDYPQCGSGVTGTTPGGTLTFYKPVDPNDTSVPFGPTNASAWVNDLEARYGSASNGGVPYYALDNEPDLWMFTHADLVPTGLRYQEFRDLTYDYAAAIKAADPAAQTLGPSIGSYAYYFNSFYDGQREDWETPDDRSANGGTPFLAWYLQQMQAYEATNGTRLLDYLDVHWYPQNGSYRNPAGNAAQQAERLDSVRALWDPTYVDPFWAPIGAPDGGVIQLIPRLRALVNANYPGTRIALSEYSWGAHNDLNGALAQADILGVFGREGLDLATLFDGRYEPDDARFAPDRPSAYAFRIYRNYDGQGSRFGNTSIQANSSDQGRLAIYAAERSSDKALTLVVINKTKTALSSQVNLGGFTTAANAIVYRYSAANLNAIVRQTDQAVSGGGFAASFPAESITLIVVPAATEQPAQENKIFIPAVRR